MKKAWLNISHFRFILFNLKIFGEIVTTCSEWLEPVTHCLLASPLCGLAAKTFERKALISIKILFC